MMTHSDRRQRILVVEDESALVDMLRYNLEDAGYVVSTVSNGRGALEAIRTNPPDLVLLDWMIPGLSGIEVCRQMRCDAASAEIPIIMLTARGEEEARIRGLESGADDFLAKPFFMAELMARVRAVFRRVSCSSVEQVLTVGDVVLDAGRYRVTRGDRQLELGPTEFRLLRHLMERPGQVFSRGSLLQAVWGQNIHVETRTVDVHIWRLRAALNADGEPDAIRTVRSAGYAFEPRPTAGSGSDNDTA